MRDLHARAGFPGEVQAPLKHVKLLLPCIATAETPLAESGEYLTSLLQNHSALSKCSVAGEKAPTVQYAVRHHDRQMGACQKPSSWGLAGAKGWTMFDFKNVYLVLEPTYSF